MVFLVSFHLMVNISLAFSILETSNVAHQSKFPLKADDFGAAFRQDPMVPSLSSALWQRSLDGVVNCVFRV